MLLALTVVFGVTAVASGVALLYQRSEQPPTRRLQVITIVNVVATIAMFTLLAIHWLSQ